MTPIILYFYGVAAEFTRGYKATQYEYSNE